MIIYPETLVMVYTSNTPVRFSTPGLDSNAALVMSQAPMQPPLRSSRAVGSSGYLVAEQPPLRSSRAVSSDIMSGTPQWL